MNVGNPAPDDGRQSNNGASPSNNGATSSNNGATPGNGALPTDPDMAAEDVGAERILACGADVDELLEQVAEGRASQRSAHQRDCVHCQATLAELEQLWAPIAATAAAPVAVPDGFTVSVMARVRRLTQDVWYTLELTEGGSISIAARIVATLARDVARRIPGVRVALGRSTNSTLERVVEKATLGHRHPNAAVGVLGRTAVVDLALAVTYGEQVDDVARQVQQSVVRILRHDIGLKTVQVNITVDDVLEDD